MFRTVACLMTAAGVLWHAVSGCCAHHGHGIERLKTSVAAQGSQGEFAETPRCRCKHASQPAAHESARKDHSDGTQAPVRTEEPAPRSPHGPCEGEPCSFVVGQITTATDLDLSPHCVGHQIVADIVDIGEPQVRENSRDLDFKPPTLRRHLALSILLI